MFKAAIFVVGLLGAASASQAAIVNLSVQGRVDGIQFETLPGASNAVLADIPLGSAYRFDYSYDTAMPATSAFGGEEFYANALLSAAFGSGSYNFSANSAQEYDAVAVYLSGAFQFPRYSVFTNFSFPAGGVQTGDYVPIDFNADLFDTRRLANPASGLPSSVEVSDYDNQYGRIRLLKVGFGEVGLLLTIDRIVGQTAGVPEPATWGMMILGFGFAGGAMRARKRTVRFAAATA
jgi:PEP-CTERM motif